MLNDEMPNPDHHSERPPRLKARLGRFFQQINKFLRRDTTPVRDLSGRIRELEMSADEISEKLSDVKDWIQSHVNERLYAHTCALIDPIIKEMTRTERIKDLSMSTPQQVKIFSRYVECMEKARVWLRLRQEAVSEEEIHQLVMNQSVLEFHARIDRDLRIIQDYLDQALNSPDMDRLDRLLLSSRVNPELAPHIECLESLKNLTTDLALDDFEDWCKEANASRERCFTAALHVIDACKVELNPQKAEIDNSHDLQGSPQLLKSIENLEQKVIKLSQDFEHIATRDPMARQVCLGVLTALEEDAHHLNSNLALSQEHSERVAATLETIYALRESI